LRKLRKKIITKYNDIKFRKAAAKKKYLELISRARYAINPSRHGAFSMFYSGSTSHWNTSNSIKRDSRKPRSTSKASHKGPSHSRKTQIKTWNEVLLIYVKEFYKT